MIDKEYGKHVLVCDSCFEEIELDTFDEAVEYKKENGWKSEKTSKGWIDLCPNCQEVERE